MNVWLIGAALMIAALGLLYLLIINLILSLAVTQVLINRMNPYPLTVHWQRAWSLHPFRIHLRGITAKGRTTSRKWHFFTPAASGTLRIWPLVGRTLGVHQIRVADVLFHQHAAADSGPIGPVIADRRPPETRWSGDGTTTANLAPKCRSWKIELRDARATGVHRVWISQIQGVLDGHIRADVSGQTPGGPFVLTDGSFDLTLASLMVDTDREITRQGHLAGTLSMSPLLPGQPMGIAALASITLDADLSCETSSLAFLNSFLGGFYGMRVDGAGRLDGRIRLEKAALQPHSRLAISARQLWVDMLAHRAEGAGTLRIDVDPQNPQMAAVSLVFESLQAFAAGSHAALFIGEGLTVSGQGPVALLPNASRKPMASDLSVTIPSMRVPDLRVYQCYLPGHWPLTLHGGQGTLRAHMEWSGATLAASLTLASTNADIGVKDYRFKSNLDVAVNANSSSSASTGIDLSGTRIGLENAKLSNRDQVDAQTWHASLKVEKGVVDLHPPDTDANGGIKRWVRAGDGRTILAALATGAQALKLNGRLSDLQWLTLLLSTPYQLAVHGTGEMRADVHLASGWLKEGTVLRIQPNQLRVDILDYTVEGDGRMTLAVERGGPNPDLNLAVTLTDASLKRRNEATAFIDKVGMQLQAAARGLHLKNPDQHVTLHLQIPSARVRDMSVYNRYLPAQSALRVLGGEADLQADIHLTPASAAGFVKLRTRRLRCRVNEQEIAGQLSVDVNLAGGTPQQMAFDISGSTLSVEHVRVAGRQREFDQADWRARLDLRNGVAMWRQPTRVIFDADVSMNDTRPLAAIMANQRGKFGWLEKIFTVADVHGQARLTITPDQIVIGHALAESDDIDVGAKGVIEDRSQDGVIYVRYKKLHGMLKIEAGGRSFHLRQARKKFEAYSPDSSGPAASIKKLSEL